MSMLLKVVEWVRCGLALLQRGIEWTLDLMPEIERRLEICLEFVKMLRSFLDGTGDSGSAHAAA